MITVENRLNCLIAQSVGFVSGAVGGKPSRLDIGPIDLGNTNIYVGLPEKGISDFFALVNSDENLGIEFIKGVVGGTGFGARHTVDSSKLLSPIESAEKLLIKNG